MSDTSTLPTESPPWSPDCSSDQYVYIVKTIRTNSFQSDAVRQAVVEEDVVVSVKSKCFVVKTLDNEFYWSITLEDCQVVLVKDFLHRILQLKWSPPGCDLVTITFSNVGDMNSFGVLLRKEICRTYCPILLPIEFVLPPCENYALTALTDLLQSRAVDETQSALVSAFRENNYVKKLMEMFIVALESTDNPRAGEDSGNGTKESSNNTSLESCDNSFLMDTSDSSLSLETLDDDFVPLDSLAYPETLRQLHELLTTLLKMNCQSFNDIFFSEEHVLDTIVLIETNPWNSLKPRLHLDFLKTCNLKEVVPLPAEFSNTIQHVFRMEYLANTVFAECHDLVKHPIRLVLQATFEFERQNVLATYLSSNDNEHLRNTIKLLDRPTTPVQKRMEIYRFVLECNNMGRADTLASFLILKKLHTTELVAAAVQDMADPSSTTELKSIVMDVIFVFPLSLIVTFCNRDLIPEDFFGIFVVEMLYTADTIVSFKIFLFLESFLREYDEVKSLIPALFKVFGSTLVKLLDGRFHESMRGPLESAEAWSYALRFLRMSLYHESRVDQIRSLFLAVDFAKRLMVLVKSPHVFLRIEVVNLLKELIQLRKKAYVNMIVMSNLFAPIIDVYTKEMHTGRDNVFQSSVRSLFDCVLNIPDQDGSKFIVSYLMNTFGTQLSKCPSSSYFFIKSRYDYAQAQTTYGNQLQQLEQSGYDENGLPVPFVSDINLQRLLIAQNTHVFHSRAFPHIEQFHEDVSGAGDPDAGYSDLNVIPQQGQEDSDSNEVPPQEYENPDPNETLQQQEYENPSLPPTLHTSTIVIDVERKRAVPFKPPASVSPK